MRSAMEPYRHLEKIDLIRSKSEASVFDVLNVDA
jgi:hypothetical protein